jgi:hypothetical protein
MRQIISLARDTFAKLADGSFTVKIIEAFNTKLNEPIYSELKTNLLDENFNVAVFDEYDFPFLTQEKNVKHLYPLQCRGFLVQKSEK